MRAGHDAVGDHETAQDEKDLHPVTSEIRELLHSRSEDAGMFVRSRVCQMPDGDHYGSEAAQPIDVLEAPRGVRAHTVDILFTHEWVRPFFCAAAAVFARAGSLDPPLFATIA
jgi:hypothetical protein